MARLGTVLWLALVAVFAAALGANANFPYDCVGGNNNLGQYLYASCQAEVCGPDTCETDECGGTCGPGYQQFCVSPNYCGVIQGCFNDSCA